MCDERTTAFIDHQKLQCSDMRSPGTVSESPRSAMLQRPSPELGKKKLGKVVRPRIISRVVLEPSKLPKSQFHLQGMTASHHAQPIR